MRKLRDILKLKLERGLSHREAAKSVGVSPGAVGAVMERARAAELTTWTAVAALTEVELENKLYGRSSVTAARPEPDPVWIHTERQKSKNVTLELLHLEYLRDHPNGFKYTAFCARYRRWVKRQRLSMRQVHRAGDKMFVDYSGATVDVTDPASGEARTAEIFVAVLGASNLTFVEATWTQKLEDWTASHVRACQYFAGVTKVWVPDQLRSAVSHPHRFEPLLNRTYTELAEHHGAVIIPARPGKPKDKAKAETGVLVAQRQLLAPLRNEQFFSLAQLNERLTALRRALNDRPMKGYGNQSRRERYELLDRPALQPLPTSHYEFARWSKQTIGRDYHIRVEDHAYSVPYQLVTEVVQIRVSAATVEAYRKGVRVCSHRRSQVTGGATTLREHMPASHRAHADTSPIQLVDRAAKIGPRTKALVAGILDSHRHPEQGYRTGLGILNLARRYGDERMEAAADRALHAGLRRVRELELLLRGGLDRLGTTDLEPATTNKPIVHDNVRGPSSFT